MIEVVLVPPNARLSTPESRRRRRWRARWLPLPLVLVLIGSLIWASQSDGTPAGVTLGLSIACLGVAWGLHRRDERHHVRVKPNHCPDCGYDLTGVPQTPDTACPECGAIDPHYDTEAYLERRRRLRQHNQGR
ncbi:MAG: hypothetical protein AAGA57_03530 [Planctomycetota bacterium]